MRSVCTTIVDLPTCSGRVTAVTSPDRTARVNTVAELVVAVCAPGGRFRKAQIPPRLSASAISTPPCKIPPVVQRSGAQGIRPRISSGAAASSTTPSPAANGIMSTSLSSSARPALAACPPAAGSGTFPPEESALAPGSALPGSAWSPGTGSGACFSAVAGGLSRPCPACPARAARSSATTSSSEVCAKSSYHSPIARNRPGISRQITSSASPRMPTSAPGGATGTASSTLAAPIARATWHAARAVEPVAMPSSTMTAIRPASGSCAAPPRNRWARRWSSARSRRSTWAICASLTCA